MRDLSPLASTRRAFAVEATQLCKTCGGTGRIGRAACPDCDGSGRIAAPRTFKGAVG